MADQKDLDLPRTFNVCWKANVPVELEPKECFYFPEKKHLDLALEELRSKKLPLQRGDLVSFEECRASPNGKTDFYRMEALCIFDGKEIIDLDDFPDEYGSLPKSLPCFDSDDYREPSFYYHDIKIISDQLDNDRGFRDQTFWFRTGQFIEQLQKNLQYRDVNYEQFFRNRIGYTWFESRGKRFTLIDDFEVPTEKFNFTKVIQELTPETELCACYQTSINGLEKDEYFRDQPECIFLSERYFRD